MNDINEVLPLLDNPEIIKFLKDVWIFYLFKIINIME